MSAALPGPSQSVFIEQVFSHGALSLRSSETGQAAHVVTQLLDGIMAVDEEVLLEEIAQLQKTEKGKKIN